MAHTLNALFEKKEIEGETMRALCLVTFDEYQKRAHSTAIQPDEGVPALMFWALAVCGEAGELAEKVKKIYRDNAGVMTHERFKAIIAEMGDVLWYLSEIASALDTTLGYVAAYNVAKLDDRLKRQVIKGEGNKR